jgi:hypothetical protein
VFVKAVRDPGRLASSLEREAVINPAVQHVSPALRWQAPPASTPHPPDYTSTSTSTA